MTSHASAFLLTAFAVGTVLCACGSAPDATGETAGAGASSTGGTSSTGGSSVGPGGTGGTGSSASTGGGSGESGAAGASASAGTSGNAGTAGVAGSGGSGGSSTGGAGGTGATGGMPPDGPGICGDGWRPVSSGEECDVGTASLLGDDLCVACVVNDALAVPLDSTMSLTSSPGFARRGFSKHPTKGDTAVHASPAPAPPTHGTYLSRGRHPVAATDDIVAVAVVQESNGQPTLGVSVFSTIGERLGHWWGVEEGTTAVWESDPVLAALPDGSLALAWTDFDGDGDELGIALRKLTWVAEDLSLGPVIRVNASTEFSQRRVDMVWTGSQLTVVWEDGSDPFDGPDLHSRTFSADLVLATDSQGHVVPDVAVSPSSAADGNAVLSSAGSEVAYVWRAAENGIETVEIRIGETQVSYAPTFAGPEDEAPSVLDLGSQHLLVAYSEGSDVPGSAALTYGLKLGVVDVAAGQALTPVTVPPSPGTTSIHEPALVAVGNQVYLSWRSDAVPGDLSGDNLWLRTVQVDSTSWAVTLGSAMRLPRLPTHAQGDQRFPSLTAVSYWPNGAILAAWEDESGSWDVEGQTVPTAENVVVELMPLPIVRPE